MRFSPGRLAERFEPLLRRCAFGDLTGDVPRDRSSKAAPGPPVCAVSGGPDSTALAVLAVAAGLRPVLAHVDHGLRTDSGRDFEHVQILAERLSLETKLLRPDIGAGPNLQERARIARHRALGPDAMLGHTQDDLAETVLIRLLRGTGMVGLAPMLPGARHPILMLRRSETVGLCADLGLTVVSDPSNSDSRFVRSRVRHELLPLADDIAGRDVTPLLARLAENAGTLDPLFDELLGDVDLDDALAVKDLPEAVRVEAIQRWWLSRSGNGHRLGAAALGRAQRVVEGSTPRAELTGGWRVERSKQRLGLVRANR